MQINGDIVAYNVAQLHQRNLVNEYFGKTRLKALIIFLHVFLEVPLKINIRLCLTINYRVTNNNFLMSGSDVTYMYIHINAQLHMYSHGQVILVLFHVFWS